MALAPFVVYQLFLYDALDLSFVELFLPLGLCRLDDPLENREGATRIPVGQRYDGIEHLIGCLDTSSTQAAGGVGQGVLQHAAQSGRLEWLEGVNHATRKQGGNDLEPRVFCRCAEKHDIAGFDERQKGILLGFVEAMDLIDEDQRLGAELAALLGVLASAREFP